MADTTRNGHLNKSAADLFEESFAQTRRNRLSYDEETERRKRILSSQIDDLRAERKKAMEMASDHAGNIGLIYHARTNTFSRVVIADDVSLATPERPLPQGSEQEEPADVIEAEFEAVEPPTEVPEIPTSIEVPKLVEDAPAAPELPKRPDPPSAPALSGKWDRHTTWKSAIAWIASILVGIFVGFGLLNLTGLPYHRPSDWVNLYGFLAIGVAAIAGMKLLFDAMWHEAGRRKALRNSEWTYTACCLLVSTIILSVEASLGGQALVYYTRRASFENKGALPLWQMILLAVAVSTANLLYSAF